MKGDFTRSTFKPRKHYSGVRMQQGRVQLDADWNEQIDITAHRTETEVIDVIGACGAPIHDAGFRIDIAPDGSDLFILPGRIYVDGILCELDPGAVPIVAIKGNKVTPETLTLDGHALIAGEWVEILYPDDTAFPRQITAVDTVSRAITLAGGAVTADPKARLRRLTTFITQPDLPVTGLGDLIMPKNAAVQDGLYIAYLDVWQRHITALEDDGIREVALGGPDTATRTKTIAQVKLLGPLDAPLNCLSEPAMWTDLLDETQNGRLSAQAAPSKTAEGPCVVPAGAGYRRLENQLYRVEIHAVDAETGKITLLKWSRDNGTTVTRWLDQKTSKPEELIVQTIGRDGVLSFGPGNYVEVVDDQRDLRGEAGILVKLANAEGQVLTLDITDPNAAMVDIANFPPKIAGQPNNPKARRWDGMLANPVTGIWLELEDGVQIKFEKGEYHVGDYWLIPARTVLADVEWPVDTASPPKPLPQPRSGLEHRFCKLAIVTHSAGSFTVTQDCRDLFPPLTELTALLYVGGDGQEAMPEPPEQRLLPQPLRVRVVNGQTPVIGAQVQFAVTQGGGSVSVAQPVATTAPDGIAECRWTLGTAGVQEATAVLLDASDTAIPGQIVCFSANLSVASQVFYDPAKCSSLAGATTVQDAIDILCQTKGGGCCVCVGKGGDYERLDEALQGLLNRGEREICICLLQGDQEVNGMEIAPEPGETDLHIKITGCGPGSRIILVEPPIRFVSLSSVILSDLTIDIASQVQVEGGALTFERCSQVELRGCQIFGFVVAGALVAISNGDHVVLSGNVFEALHLQSFSLAREIFEAVAQGVGVETAARLFSLPDQRAYLRATFSEFALSVAQELTALSLDKRKQMQAELEMAVQTPEQRSVLSQGELLSYLKLGVAIQLESLDPTMAFALLMDIRRAAAKARSGTAIVLSRSSIWEEVPEISSEVNILDQDDIHIVENNEIIGILSLYGLPSDIPFIDQLLDVKILKHLDSLIEDNQIRLVNGCFGTLQLRGNQLVRVAVAHEVIGDLRKAADSGSKVVFPRDLFSRCLWSENVFEGGRNFLVCRHLTLQANEFTQSAEPPPVTLMAASIPIVAATIVADSAIYVANHGTNNVTLYNISRLMQEAVNQELTIS